jgi:hypothetical protein
MEINSENILRKFPRHGYIGIFLLITAWAANWCMPGLRTQWGFFFQWLGYILLIDAIVFTKKARSIYSDNSKSFIALFIYSIPFWWLFELLNLRTQYWFYEARENFTDVEYALLASLSFSTVIPAILETYELLSLLKVFQKTIRGPKLKESRENFLLMLFVGIIMLVLVLVYPKQLPYFLWISLYFIFEPFNYFLGFPTLLSFTRSSNWRPVLQVFLAGLCCGFLWELWNYYSYPRWQYHLPGFEYLYVFEMPLAGYLGYLPFALELWAYYHLVKGLFGKIQQQYLRRQ